MVVRVRAAVYYKIKSDNFSKMEVVAFYRLKEDYSTSSIGLPLTIEAIIEMASKPKTTYKE